MIPERLIRCVPEVVPEDWELNWATWEALHPDWELVTIQDPIDADEWPQLGRWHQHCTSGAQLAGLIRLESVWKWGGVYVDADMEPLRPIDPLLVHPLFIGTEDGTHLTDAMFGAEREHDGLWFTMVHVDQLFQDWQTATIRHTCPPYKNPLPPPGAQATGPLATTACLTGRSDVTVLAQRMLYPYSYTERERRNENFRETSPESYAVHHWSFSWQDPPKETTDA